MQKREKRDLGLGQSAKSRAPNFFFTRVGRKIDVTELMFEQDL